MGPVIANIAGLWLSVGVLLFLVMQAGGLEYREDWGGFRNAFFIFACVVCWPLCLFFIFQGYRQRKRGQR